MGVHVLKNAELLFGHWMDRSEEIEFEVLSFIARIC